MAIDDVIESFLRGTYVDTDLFISMVNEIKDSEERDAKIRAVNAFQARHSELKRSISEEGGEIKRRIVSLPVSGGNRFVDQVELSLKSAISMKQTHYDIVKRILTHTAEYISESIGTERVSVALLFARRGLPFLINGDEDNKGSGGFFDPYLNGIDSLLNVSYEDKEEPYLRQIYATKGSLGGSPISKLGGRIKHVLRGNVSQLCCNKKLWKKVEGIAGDLRDPLTGEIRKDLDYKEWRKIIWRELISKREKNKSSFYKNVREVWLPLFYINRDSNIPLGLIQTDSFKRKGLKGMITEALDFLLSKIDRAKPLPESKIKEIKDYINFSSKIVSVVMDVGSIMTNYYIAFAKEMTEMINQVDDYTSQHVKDVIKIACNLYKVYEFPLDEKERSTYLLMLGAYLHDIGKFFVSKEDLLHKGRDEERIERINKHTEYGVEVLKNTSVFPEVLDMIQYHHTNGKERESCYAGNDYSKTLTDLLMVADKLVAIMDSRRDKIYRKAREGKINLTPSERLKILKSECEKYDIGFADETFLEKIQKI